MATRKRRLRTRRKKLKPIKIYRPTEADGEVSADGVPVVSPISDPDSLLDHQNLFVNLQLQRKGRPLTPDLLAQSSLGPVLGRSYSSLGIATAPWQYQRPVPDQLSSGFEKLSPRCPETQYVDPGNLDAPSSQITANPVTDTLSVTANPVTDPAAVTPTSSDEDIFHSGSEKWEAEQADKLKVPDVGAWTSDKDDRTEDGDVGDSDSDDETDSQSISDSEKGNEPSIDCNRKIPELHLRPEKLDHVPEHPRDMRRFEFDAEKLSVPAYEFKCPVPSPFTEINFRVHAKEKNDWRMSAGNMGSVDPALSALFDRLVEMEKRQIETEDWERRMRLIKRRPPSRNSKPREKSRDKRCCNTCHQPACAGDCPAKKVPANYSETSSAPVFCVGLGKDSKYESRSRQLRDEPDIMMVGLRPMFSHSCKTCQKRNSFKFPNLNSMLLTRSKSAISALSRGKSSAKPKDIRPKSAFTLSECLAKDFEKLGLELVQPMPPSKSKTTRPRSSRGDVNLSKSYSSNLTRSLTELTVRKSKSAKLNKRSS